MLFFFIKRGQVRWGEREKKLSLDLHRPSLWMLYLYLFFFLFEKFRCVNKSLPWVCQLCVNFQQKLTKKKTAVSSQQEDRHEKNKTVYCIHFSRHFPPPPPNIIPTFHTQITHTSNFTLFSLFFCIETDKIHLLCVLFCVPLAVLSDNMVAQGVLYILGTMLQGTEFDW